MKKFIFILFLLFCKELVAQDIAVPVDVQLPLFFKIFAYDKNFNLKIGAQLDIVIVYQKKFITSMNIKNSVQSILESDNYKVYNSLPVTVKSVSIESVSELDNYLRKNNADVLYLAPLRALNISELAEITRARKILTITGVPQYVEQGLSVGIGIKNEKPQIIINLTASKSEGSNFSSQLLKLAKVIEE